MRLLAGMVVACAALVAGASLARGSTDDGATSLRPAEQPLRGLVSTSAVGPLRFGASQGMVEAWAGAPEFTRRPLRPELRPGAVIWGYHCVGIDPATGKAGDTACHTEFGFKNGKLTSFGTASRLFSLRNGVRPGMTVEEAERRLPDAAREPGCSRLRLHTPAGAVLVVQIARWPNRPRVFSLYASTGRAAFGAPCGG